MNWNWTQTRSWLKTAVIILLLLWYGLFLIQKIDLTTADLGRHLKNGELLLTTNYKLLTTNFYSYTQPDFPVINHHWGSGVIFYLIWKIFGFVGLHLFSISLLLIAFLFFFDIARRESGFKTAVLLSFFFIPLIAQRAEIRPEVFTYLFSGLFFWLLWHLRQHSLVRKGLLALICSLPLIQLVWVNTHIYFFLGPLLVITFLVEAIVKKSAEQIKILGLLLFLTLAASFISPFGTKGLLYPLKIFENYGYRIVENQSILFLQKFGLNNPNLLIFEISFGLLAASFVAVLFANYRRLSLAQLLLLILLSIMGWLALRNFTIFGFFVLPIIASNLRVLLEIYKEKQEAWSVDPSVQEAALIFVIFVTIVSVLWLNASRLTALPTRFGLGLAPVVEAAAEFFKKNNLTGPIFNNYDIGSYLIYHLYPQAQVFVDNRPEAYSQEFFNEIYVPMQENNDIFESQDQKYSFNAIFFGYHDLTPWGQKFLVERIGDPNWASVFADDYAIIFLKRNIQNQSLIEKYEIPKERFSVIQR